MNKEIENEFAHVSRNFTPTIEGLTRKLIVINRKPMEERDREKMKEIVKEIKRRASNFLGQMEKFEHYCEDED